MMKKKVKSIILLVSILTLSTTVSATEILVAHPITVGISEVLLKDSSINIIQAVPKKLPATRQLHYLETKGKAALVKLSKNADVAITVRSLYAKDYLYPLARRSNINIIPIDIAQPIDGKKPGVAKLSSVKNVEHPVWLDPNSLLTMMTIFSNEINRLEPTDTTTREIISKNLQYQQKQIRKIINTMEITLDELEEEPVVLILNPKLRYFVQGLQLPYHVTKTEKITDIKLQKLVEELGISVVISSKKISNELKTMLTEKGVGNLSIKRFKAQDPIVQLETIYSNFTAALKH